MERWIWLIQFLTNLLLFFLEFGKICSDYFLSRYDGYLKFAEARFELDGKDMYDPLYCMSLGKFNFRGIERRLKEIKRCLDNGISPTIITGHPMAMLSPSLGSNSFVPPFISPSPIINLSENFEIKLPDMGSFDFISPTSLPKLKTPLHVHPTTTGSSLGDPNEGLNGKNSPSDSPKQKKRKLSNSTDSTTISTSSTNNGKKMKGQPETLPSYHSDHISPLEFPISFSNSPLLMDPLIHSEDQPIQLQQTLQASPFNLLLYQHQSLNSTTNPLLDIRVRPPSLEEMGLDSNMENYDSDVICVVCHQIPMNFVVLPNCLQPHIFCIHCASKLAKQGPSSEFFATIKQKKGFDRSLAHQMRAAEQSTYVSCVLCQRLSELKPPFNSLHHINQRNPTKCAEADKTMCAEHHLLLDKFCPTFMQFVCPACVLLPRHAEHSHYADFVQVNPIVNEKLNSQIETLKNQATEITAYRQAIEERKLEVASSAKQVKDVHFLLFLFFYFLSLWGNKLL